MKNKGRLTHAEFICELEEHINEQYTHIAKFADELGVRPQHIGAVLKNKAPVTQAIAKELGFKREKRIVYSFVRL